MGDYDDLGLILDVHRTPSPFGEEGPNEMETLAIAAYEPSSYKHVVVNMRGVNGNAMVIVGTVKKALQRAGASKLDLACFVGQALAGDYENVLATVAAWVTISDEPTVKSNDAWDAFVQCATKEG